MHVEGIINLRGKVTQNISMRRRFNLMESAKNSQTRIIIMDVCGSLTGFIVDAVTGVIRIHSSEIQPPPSMVLSGGVGQEFITGVFNHAERLLSSWILTECFRTTNGSLLGSCRKRWLHKDKK